MSQKIYQHIVDQTIPARLPKPWGFLSPVDNVLLLAATRRSW